MSASSFLATICFLVVSMLSTAAVQADGPLAGAVIVVDAGHGGQRYSKSYTGGTRGVGSRQTESELNLRVSFELARLLREDGATVYMTREADHRLSPEGSAGADELHARIDFFNHYGPHFFLSVHHNAGRRELTGHTSLYKHNATDSTLYEALARDVNNALEGAVPGPKQRLIGDRSYHILRETQIPGTISESGYMTNPAFDDLCVKPGYPRVEAAAIRKGAVKYWKEHQAELVALKKSLDEERASQPRDPATITAIAFNRDFQAKMTERLARIAPDGKYVPANAGQYVEKFKAAYVTEPGAVFDVRADVDGKQIKLKGTTSDVKYHNELIDLFVAMKLFDLKNEIEFPKEEERARDAGAAPKEAGGAKSSTVPGPGR